jgi:type II secretory pathway pseudopilin PulG
MAQIRKIMGSSGGLTIIEVVIALAILFFVISAVVGLLGSSNNLSNKSRQRTALADACNSYIEDVRNLPFTSVGLQGGSPAGVLAAQTVLNLGSFTITIRPTVTWVNDPKMPGAHVYKQLTLSAFSTSQGKRVATYTTTTYVRDTGMESTTSTIPPVCDFGSHSDAILLPPTAYKGIIGLDASTTALMHNATIQHVIISVDTTACRDSSAAQAIWTPGTTHWDNDSGGLLFQWDSTAMDNGQWLSPDGVRTLQVWVDDSMGQQASVTRTIYLDNYAPVYVTASSLIATSTTDVTSTVSWAPAQDGTAGNWADHYMVNYYKQRMTDTGSTFTTNSPPWASDGQTNDWHSCSCPKTTTSFSRYRASIQAHSYYNWALTGDSWMAHAWVSRPTATGTYLLKTTGSGATLKATTDITITVPWPTFPTTTLNWSVYYSLSPITAGNPGTAIMSNATTTTSPFTYHRIETKNLVNATDPNYYQVQANFVPNGWDASSSTIRSNNTGPVGTTKNVKTTMGVTW